MTKIVSILPRLQEMQDFFSHMDMKCKMVGILAQAISEMRDLGASSQDIAATLRYVANEMPDT